jgi:hypothetical protein
VVLISPVRAAADDAAALEAIIERASPSIVIVKVVMKTSAQGAERETKADMTGVVVDKNGLVMISNMMFSYARVNALLGRNVGAGQEFKTYPTDMTTLFDQDDKEYPTTLVATDTKLDLAFVKVEGLGAKKLTPVEFNHGAAGLVGQEVVSVSRLHKGFDYAPFFMTSRICGAIIKPRKAYMVEGGLEGLGLPVFTMTGEPLGVLTTLEPGIKEEALIEGMTFHNFTQSIIGGKGGFVPTFVLPAQTIYGVVTQARLKAAESKKDETKVKGKP